MEIEVKVTEGKGVRRILDIRVEAKDVEFRFKDATDNLKKEVKVDGFRPGRAPEHIIQTRYKSEIFETVMEKMLTDAFSEALEKANIRPVGEPELKDVNLKRGEPLTFRAILDIQPEVKPVGFTGLKLKRKPYKITDHDVDMGIRVLKERLAVANDVDRPSREGDIVIVDMTRLKGGDNIGEVKNLGTMNIQLDKEKSLPEFVDNLTGKTVGEEAEFMVKYPKDYFEKELANFTFNYHAKVKNIREKKLPETDPELIGALRLKDEDGTSLPPEKLPEKVRFDLQQRSERNVRRDLEDQAVRQLTEKNQFELPQSVMEHYLENLVKNYKSRNEKLDEDKLRDDLKPVADNHIRWFYLRDAIADEQNIKITDSDMKEYRGKVAQNSGANEDEVNRYLQGEGRLERVKEDLLEQKVLDFLIANAEIEDIGEEKKELEKENTIIITPERK